MCGKKSGTYVKLFCLLSLLLLSSFSFSQEKKYYLTETEMTELTNLINESEKEIKELKITLMQALEASNKALSLQIASQENYNELEKYWQKREDELKTQLLEEQNKVVFQDKVIKIGAITVGTTGLFAFLLSLVR